jgi:hypothetical protein
MGAALWLFAIAWGVSPIILLWMIISIRDTAKQVPVLQQEIKNTAQQRDVLSRDLDFTRRSVVEKEKSIEAIGKRLLKDNVKSVSAKITANNYATSKKAFETVFEFCDKHGFAVPLSERKNILDDLKNSFEDAVKKQWHKEEQARIKSQIREEQKLEAERQRELQRLENQELAVQTALQKALQKTQGEHDSEVERLRAQLQEAQEKLQRAKSMAQMTRAGFVYVISNVGSFGNDLFKVGMTRRLEPMDRVRELGDASVPFPYDVHMLISCDDAPALENTLHKELQAARVNKVNPRREFFRTDIQTLARLVEKNHGKVDYVLEPEALEYNESLNMSDEDFEYVAEQTSQFDEDEEGFSPDRAGATAPARPVIPSTPVNVPNAVETQTGTDSEEAEDEERQVVSCPLCDVDIFADTLVDGENKCTHCNGVFSVSME